jgi:hypothetical protein
LAVVVLCNWGGWKETSVDTLEVGLFCTVALDLISYVQTFSLDKGSEAGGVE